MAVLIKEIKTYLVAQGIDSANNIYLDLRPDAPDNIISIFEYAGTPGHGREIDERRIQFQVRNTSYTGANAKINAIRDLLDAASPEQIVTLGTSRSTVFSAIQTPFKLEEDARKRTIFACNFRAITERD